MWFDTGDLSCVLKSHLLFFSAARYCVAPIISGEAPLATYDFWAVGVNCCGALGLCGGFGRPAAIVLQMFWPGFVIRRCILCSTFKEPLRAISDVASTRTPKLMLVCD